MKLSRYIKNFQGKNICFFFVLVFAFLFNCKLDRILCVSSHPNLSFDLNNLSHPTKIDTLENKKSGDLIFIGKEFHATLFESGRIYSIFRVKNTNNRIGHSFSFSVFLWRSNNTCLGFKKDYEIGPGRSKVFRFLSNISLKDVHEIKLFSAFIVQKSIQVKPVPPSRWNFLRKHKWLIIFFSCLLVTIVSIGIYSAKKKKLL